MVRADSEVLMQVVPPLGHGVDDGEPFFIQDWVVAFGLGECSAEEMNWMPLLRMLLLQDRANSKCGGVAGNACGKRRVEDGQHRRLREKLLDGAHGLPALMTPVEGGAAAGEAVQRCGD